MKYFVQLLAVGGIFFLVARLPLQFVSGYQGSTANTAGFAIAAIVLAGFRILPAIVAAAFLVNSWGSGPSYSAAVSAAADSFEACAGAVLLNLLAGGRNAFSAPTTVARFVLIAMVSSAIGASVRAAVGASVGPADVDWGKFAFTWVPWWLGDLAAILIITPVLVLWVTDRPRSFDLVGLLEATGIFAASGAIGTIAFGPLITEMPYSAIPSRTALSVFAILPLIWAALRRGPRDTATVAFILSGLMIWGTIYGSGPLAPTVGPEASAFLLAYVIGISVPSLILSTDVALRKRADRILSDHRRDLGQAREQLAQTNKLEALGQLIGGVAHDFNNLLAVIVGNLNIAQRHLDSLTEAPAERLRRLVTNAMRGADRATAITQRLLTFSRKQPLHPQPVNINEQLNGLRDFLRRSLGETVVLNIVVANGLGRVKADPMQLEAAILNLAVNARHAMPGGGTLTIKTNNSVLDDEYVRKYDELVAGPYVQISVSDSGTGMSKDVLERVFEPFFTTKEAGQGTGLGMSQVYGFVKHSGGHIEIDSEPGVGTTVRIYLPELPAGPHEDEISEPEGLMADSTRTILLVEDDHDVRACMAEILRELNYRVLEAHDAESALGLIDRNNVQVDLLLSDLVLPGMSGLQLAEKIRARDSEVAALFMTGYSPDVTANQGHFDPAAEVLYKPLTQPVLEERIRAALKRKG